jgi:hypothetical protein
MTANTAFPTLLEAVFTERLIQQKRARAHTIASYRDTCRFAMPNKGCTNRHPGWRWRIWTYH